jgi:Ca-activated chloride channel family protein
MTTFGSPWLLALAGLVVLRLILLLRDRRAHIGALEFSSTSIVDQKRSVRRHLTWIPVTLELAGWLLLIIALARPQTLIATATDRYGVDIVITLDASGRMAAEDFRPRNRFTVAKELIADFIESRVDDRIGIVTFGARAATRVPITFDRTIARDVLEKAQVGENGDGTAIGHAIATAVNRLRGSRARSRVIILVTDGVNNAGSIEPTTAATLARKFGIRIYPIGVGSRGAVPIPVKVQNRFTGEVEVVRQFIRADLDEEMLSAIADSTGGSYFRAVDERALESILARIDRLEKSRLAAPRERDVRELYVQPLSWGLSLLALAFLLGETIWMLLPA